MRCVGRRLDGLFWNFWHFMNWKWFNFVSVWKKKIQCGRNKRYTYSTFGNSFLMTEKKELKTYVHDNSWSKKVKFVYSFKYICLKICVTVLYVSNEPGAFLTYYAWQNGTCLKENIWMPMSILLREMGHEINRPGHNLYCMY